MFVHTIEACAVGQSMPRGRLDVLAKRDRVARSEKSSSSHTSEQNRVFMSPGPLRSGPTLVQYEVAPVTGGYQRVPCGGGLGRSLTSPRSPEQTTNAVRRIVTLRSVTRIVG